YGLGWRDPLQKAPVMGYDDECAVEVCERVLEVLDRLRSRWFVGSSRTRQLTPRAETSASSARVRSPGESGAARGRASSAARPNFASSVGASASVNDEAVRTSERSSDRPAKRVRAWSIAPSSTPGPTRREPAASGCTPSSASTSVVLPLPFG